jgi:hypothetical protein
MLTPHRAVIAVTRRADIQETAVTAWGGALPHTPTFFSYPCCRDACPKLAVHGDLTVANQGVPIAYSGRESIPSRLQAITH